MKFENFGLFRKKKIETVVTPRDTSIKIPEIKRADTRELVIPSILGYLDAIEKTQNQEKLQEDIKEILDYVEEIIQAAKTGQVNLFSNAYAWVFPNIKYILEKFPKTKNNKEFKRRVNHLRREIRIFFWTKYNRLLKYAVLDTNAKIGTDLREYALSDTSGFNRDYGKIFQAVSFKEENGSLLEKEITLEEFRGKLEQSLNPVLSGFVGFGIWNKKEDQVVNPMKFTVDWIRRQE